MIQGAGPMQVEKVLDDLIQRLSKSESSADVRAALIEARRLRNVTMRWAAIPPPPDARREMLSRVMDLVAKVGTTNAGGSLRPAHDRKSTPTAPPSSGEVKKEGGLAKMGSMRPTAPPPPGHPASAGPAASEYQRKTNTLNYGVDSPRTGLRSPVTAKPPSPRPLAELDEPALSVPPQMRSYLGPQRSHTIAGIPEANEPPPGGERARPRSTQEPPKRKISSASLDVQQLTSASPSSPLPAVRPRSTPAPSPSIRPSASTSSDHHEASSAPPPLRRTIPRGTLMMGSIAVNDAIEVALAEAAAESPSVANAIAEQRSPTPPVSVRAVAMPHGGRVEGFSSAVSSPAIAAARSYRAPASHPTMVGTPLPPPTSGSPSSLPPQADKPLRAIVAPGVTIVRPEASAWRPHPFVVGVTLKVLFRDPRSGVYTALVRLAPGAQLPRRRHVAPEEAFLVSGVAHVGGHEMRPGEYSRAESETIHEPITTATGCTFFLCGSEHDELLDES